MAATNPSRRRSEAATAETDGVGIAHLTVVPTNFDSVERERDVDE